MPTKSSRNLEVLSRFVIGGLITLLLSTGWAWGQQSKTRQAPAPELPVAKDAAAKSVKSNEKNEPKPKASTDKRSKTKLDGIKRKPNTKKLAKDEQSSDKQKTSAKGATKAQTS